MSDAIAAGELEAAKVSRLDILAFFGSFIGGLIVYFVLRELGVRQLIVTVSIIAVMFLYAMLVAKVPRLRVRLDQAGDNAYYLGLLFTLFSMAVALYEFSSTQLGTASAAADGSGAKQIIGNFGIALGTTIAGIFLRVLMHQMRVDPADVESATRIELAEAAKRVKASLDTVSIETARLLDDMRQRTSDHLGHLAAEVGNTLRDFALSVTATLTELTNATAETHAAAAAKVADATGRLVDVAKEAEAAAGRLRRVEPPPLELASRLETVSKALDMVAGQAERVGDRLTSAGEVTTRANDAFAVAARQLVETTELAGRQQEGTTKQIEAAATRFTNVLAAVGDTLEEDRRRLATLEQQLVKSAQATQDSQDAAKRVLDNLVEMTRGLTQFVNRNG